MSYMYDPGISIIKNGKLHNLRKLENDHKIR
jgi:hypothetical protein